jgi:hypothetical protein
MEKVTASVDCSFEHMTQRGWRSGMRNTSA